MKKNLLLSAAVAVCVLVFMVPSATRAYFSNSQSAVVLDGGVVYMVEYSFGFPQYDLYLPIMAQRSEQAMATATSTVEYAIIDDSEATSSLGITSGIVLSNAEIRDGQYFIPKGQARQMILLVAMATSSKDVVGTTPHQLALQVTSLPFTMIDNGTAVPGHLNPTELQYYATPNAKVFPKSK